MPSNAELYDYYCRRSACHPNSSVKEFLESTGSNALEVLDVSSNYLGQRGLIPVLDIVKNTKTMHTLDVSNNELGVEHVQHLAYCLAMHPSMRNVRLCRTGLHDGHTEVLLQLLSMNTSIQELMLDGNHFTPPRIKTLEEALLRNRKAQQALRAEENTHAAYLAEKAATTTTAKRTFSAVLSGSIPAAESGGYVHYANWFKNPQFCVQTSRTSRVSFELGCTQDDSAANQMGLMVLRHDGVHRAVEITKTTIVAESPVSDKHCAVQALLDYEESYVVMPYTFNPGRALQFRLTATLINDHAAQEEGWVTLEKLDVRYDWCTCSIEDGAWTTANAGGSGCHTTWRRNDMYHLTSCSTSDRTDSSNSKRIHTAKRSALSHDATTATIYILLIKEVDPYSNDDRAIGIDVVTHDVLNPSAPPLLFSSDVVCASLPHASTSFALLKVQLPASNVDVYVVPSTELPGQTGTYTLTVFSSMAVQLTRSVFPHAWRYRVMDGAWDETCCGGCRTECLSWKNNPSIEVHVEDVAQPLIACVELRTMATTAAGLGVAPPSADAPAAAEVGKEKRKRLEAAPHKAELVAFRERHRSPKLEVGITAVDIVAPAFSALATSAQQEHSTSVVIRPTRPVLYVVPMLRHAADIAVYTLELFSPSPFVVESTDAVCLATRERLAQLAAYALESERRASILQAAEGHQQQSGKGLHDSAPLQAERKAILERVSHTGLSFVDRDFPRGISSLFLDPAGPLPLDFPAQTTWKRVSEMSPIECDVSPANMGPPYPYSPRHWFASVLQAVAAKPGWLARIFVQYAREAGFAQFAFYKQDDWVGVTIDDYLLVDNRNELLYGHGSSSSGDTHDFFFPLAEKAYAKLHRCYEAMEPKVNPDQTTLDLLCQGLMDATSGFTSVVRIRPCDKPDQMPVEEEDQLWRKLKRAIEPSLLCAFMLDSGGSVTRERSHVGLLPDRLYGVMDARFVEQQRLVKIRLFGSLDSDEKWQGKWAFDSPRWNTTLRDVLHYHTPEPHVAWMHFDEVLYYFTHAFVTEVGPQRINVAGSFAEAMDNEAESAAPSLRNPQFALSVTPASAAKDTVMEVHIGVHRRDPRLDVTRTRAATARLKTGLGFAVFATEDNARRLNHVADDELLQLVKPSVKRDQYVTLQLTLDFLRARKITVMPFRENLCDPDVSYTLSASCAGSTSAIATVQLAHVTPNTSIIVSGRWGAEVKTGPPNFPQWRNNPQFFLSAAQETEVTVTLRPTCTTTAMLGFTLHNTRRCSSFLNFDPATVVTSAASNVAGAAPSCVVRLAGTAERRGMPYVLVPYSSEETGEFQLEVVGNLPLQLRPIDPRLDWHRVRHNVSISAADGNTGGNPATAPSWRFNPQLVLTFPVERDGRLFISAKRVRSADPRVRIGMLLLRADAPVAGSYRRRITYSEADVVARSTDGPAESVLDTEVVLPGDREALILVVYADQPYKEADVELSLYAAPTLELQPVKEWSKVLMQEGSWDLGMTASGSRTNFASWINNPFFCLSVLRPTTVTLLLVQYPRDHEHPVVKRYGTQKAFLPPPLVHPDRCSAIQLSVAKYDAVLTEVGSTTPTRNAETSIVVELGPEQSYLVVPCTQEPQYNIDFKLFAFADHPFELYVAEKPRLPYV